MYLLSYFIIPFHQNLYKRTLWQIVQLVLDVDRKILAKHSDERTWQYNVCTVPSKGLCSSQRKHDRSKRATEQAKRVACEIIWDEGTLPEPTPPTIVLCLHSITWLFPGLSEHWMLELRSKISKTGMVGRQIVFQKCYCRSLRNI